MKFPAVKDYPREIYVKDITYQIRYVNKIKGKKRLLGLCDDDAKIIWVRKTQSPRGIFRTLLHELLHAAACLAAGGEVTRLEIAPQYGGGLMARVFPFVVSGGEVPAI